MNNLKEYIRLRIREMRSTFGGSGLSQEQLAKELDINPNTISRWELGSFKPGIEELEKLSKFFGVSITEFFPKENTFTKPEINALISTVQKLETEDLNELKKYAEFRIALRQGPRPRLGRRPKELVPA